MVNQRGFIAAVLAGVFGLLFVVATIFGLWAFSSREDYKNNSDQKAADAVAIAVQQTETAKETEFVEREKEPTRTYTGPETYGSLSFAYPKTWSIYAEQESSGTVLDVYGFPGVVPGISNEQVYAVRAEITSQSYDSEVDSLQNDIDRGLVTAEAFRPANVPSVLGLKVVGEIEREVQGQMVLLPLRDRTIKVFTEAPQFFGDFNTIILPSLTFVP